MTDSLRYILIDDDAINNTICKLCIKKTLGEVPITTFTNPLQGFQFLQHEYGEGVPANPAILFLDINMPEINGWDFLEMFDKLSEDLKRRIRIVLLSSSINQIDIEKAKADKNVVAFISKPLSREVLVSIVND